MKRNPFDIEYDVEIFGDKGSYSAVMLSELLAPQ